MKLILCFSVFVALAAFGVLADVERCPTCSNIQNPCSCTKDEKMLKSYDTQKICCISKRWFTSDPAYQILEQPASEAGDVTKIQPCRHCWNTKQHCGCPSYEQISLNIFYDLCCAPRPWTSFTGQKFRLDVIKKKNNFRKIIFSVCL